ncbi:MAG TPA: lysozyme inhibitor LprI family protein [Croceibacterium sp.]
MIGVTALLLVAQAGAADAIDCDTTVIQPELNRCAEQDLVSADGALNAQWQETAAFMKARDENGGPRDDGRPGYFEILLASQRAWLAFRDAQCNAESMFERGGQIHPMMAAHCKAYMTELRTQQLRDLAARAE